MIQPFNGKHPKIHPTCMIHPSAVIIGDVELGPHVSVWPNATLRGDCAKIIVEARSNIQDGAVLHCDEGINLWIGPDVTIGHLAMLHSATIEEGSLIGMHATILQAKIAKETLIAAHSLIRSGQHCEAGCLYAGVPAVKKRELKPSEIAAQRKNAAHYVQLAADYVAQY